MKQSVENVYINSPNHWWIQSRHNMIKKLINNLDVNPPDQILDAGCTNGGLVERLREMEYKAYGIDISRNLVGNSKDSAPIVQADATRIPFNSGTFKIVIASDLIEHIKRDDYAIQEFKRVITRNGYLVIFVPAFQWLWSSSDERDGHHRRYTKNQLTDTLQQNGFDILRSSYWNLSTSPIGVPLKIYDRMLSGPIQSFSKTNSTINYVLEKTLMTENRLIEQGYSVPFGLSVFALATPSKM